MSLPGYVIHWEAPGWCGETVRSLQSSSVPVDVTVIDNSSNYNGPGAIERPGRNLGYAGAANLALRSAAAQEAEWCVIACHDAVAAPDAVERLLEVRRVPYAILGAVLDGEIPGWVRSGEDDGVVPANTVIGTLMLVNVTAALAVGGFDERYGSYYEEVDLCHRLWMAGHRVGFAKYAQVSTKGSSSRSAEALKHGNHVLLTLKEDGQRAALAEVSRLGGRALAAALRGAVAARRSRERDTARDSAHAFAIGSVKLVRYWRLGSVQATHGILPE